MLNAIAEIADSFRDEIIGEECTYVSSEKKMDNVNMDEVADNILWNACRRPSSAGVIHSAAAASKHGESKLVTFSRCDEDEDGPFTVYWNNVFDMAEATLGTVVSIWEKDALLRTALAAYYGPRTAVLAALDDGTYEFAYGLDDPDLDHRDESWVCTRQKILLHPDGAIFSPANLPSMEELPGYKALMDYYMFSTRDDGQPYILRYSGSVLTDIHRIFLNNDRGGMFCSPTCSSHPSSLRLVFDALPFALLVERAHGKTSDGLSGRSIFDVEPASLDQQTALCLGSVTDVDRFHKYLIEGKYST